MNASRCLLLTAILMLPVALAHAQEYDEVAVIPLPLPPPTELGRITAALEPYGNLHSRLVDTQIALWLQKLPASELQTIRGSIPNLWGGPGTADEFAAFGLGLAEVIPEALSTHPDLQLSVENPLTVIQAGRVDGTKDFRAALVTAGKIEDEKLRTQYLLGVIQTAGRANSYREAQEVREAVLPLLPFNERHTLTSYQFDEWTYLWPAESIAAWALTLPERQRFNTIRHVLDHGAEFFASLEEAADFLPYFGPSAKGQAPCVAQAMSPVLAARNPQDFMNWWLVLPQNDRLFAIDHAIRPLLRHNPKLIDEIMPYLTSDSLVSHADVTREWFNHDPVAAWRWCSEIPDHAEHFYWWLTVVSLTKPMDPALAIELMDRFPKAEDKLTLSRGFDPRRQKPETVAREILRLTNPEARRGELIYFALKWGHWDGPSALTWADAIPEEVERKLWVKTVLDRWMDKSPEEALQAAMACPALPPEELTKLKESLPGRLRQISDRNASKEPSRYARPLNEKTVTLANGGETAEAAVVELRHTLAALARPGEPAVSNATLCAQVLRLGQATVVALLARFEISAPVDAKENALRILLLERWALSAPEPAARWIIEKGNGTQRAVLPLALATLAPREPELAMKFTLQIPDDYLTRLAQQSIVSALAGRSYREACELGERFGADIQAIIKHWLRADAASAEAWLRVRWREER